MTEQFCRALIILPQHRQMDETIAKLGVLGQGGPGVAFADLFRAALDAKRRDEFGFSPIA